MTFPLCSVLLLFCVMQSASPFHLPQSILARKHTTTSLSSSTTTITAANPNPSHGYDSLQINKTYDAKFFTIAYRLNILGVPLLFWYFRLLMDKKVLKRDRDPSIQRLRGVELRNILVQSGSVAFIKTGQGKSRSEAKSFSWRRRSASAL